MKLRTHLLLSILSFIGLFSYSQNTVEFRQLRGENVPTQSITYAVANDSTGNVWIASEEGVLKHNSEFYKIYNSYNGLPEIVGNRIKEVFVDSKQRIWIGSEKGVCLYNEDLDIFEFVESVNELNPSLVDVIVEDDNLNIWAGGYNGLWKYVENESSSKFNRIVGNYNVQALHHNKGKLIFGTQKGVFYYNDKSNLFEEVKINSEEKNIRFITSIDDQILIGTKTGGLYKIDKGQSAASQINFDFQLSDAITDIIKNSQNTFLLATDGDGIYKLNLDFKKIDHYTENPNETFSISSNGVYDIEWDREGILWAATYGGGLNYFNSGELPFQNIHHKINDENSIVTNFTRSIAKDENGNIWFGTKKGISILNSKNNSWKHIKNLSNTNNDEDVIVLALEPDGNFMWAGTYNEGLFKININTLREIHYNSEVSEGIIEKVYAIHKDSKK